MWRSIDAATSSAVITDPSWNFTPLRSVYTYVRPSALSVNDSARLGWSCPWTSVRISGSMIWLTTGFVFRSYATT